MKNVVPGIGQGSLFVPEELRAPELPPGFDLDQRVTFSHMIRVISDYVDLPYDYTTESDLERVVPERIETGLCFGPHEAYSRRIKNVYEGVGFSATQFLELARSPADLAASSYSKAQRANEKRPSTLRLDRDEAHQTASGSAGHTLEKSLTRLDVLNGQISSQRLCLLALHREIHSGGYAHWSGRNLDGLRKTGSDVIHGDMEISAVTLRGPHAQVERLQRAIHYNLYGHAGHNPTRVGYWDRYVLMAGKHTRRQLAAIAVATGRTSEELEKYQPYLSPQPANA